MPFRMEMGDPNWGPQRGRSERQAFMVGSAMIVSGIIGMIVTEIGFKDLISNHYHLLIAGMYCSSVLSIFVGIRIILTR